MWGWGYSFSMWQMLQMCQMLSKCISPYAYHAYLCQNSRRIRHFRRPSTENHTLPVILPGYAGAVRVRRRPRLLNVPAC